MLPESFSSDSKSSVLQFCSVLLLMLYVWLQLRISCNVQCFLAIFTDAVLVPIKNSLRYLQELELGHPRENQLLTVELLLKLYQ